MTAKTHRPNRRPTAEATNSAPARSRCHRVAVIFIATLVALLAVRIMKSVDIEPEAYTLPEPRSLKGPLAPNEKLKKTSRLLEKKVHGPESIIVHKGNVYSGDLFGKVIKIDPSGKMSVFVQLGNGSCDTIWACGRPLGMRLDKSAEFFYFADAYLGVFKVDLETAATERIFPFDDRFRVTLFNDLDVLSDGSLVVTESSVKWPLHHLVSDALESAGNGRLIVIRPKQRTYEVVAKGLYFANGVEIDLRDGGESVLVAETWRCRIRRIFVSGPRRGQVETFAENLPGMPDNLRATEAGDGYWVGLATVRAKEFPGHSDDFSSWPTVRRVLHRVLPLSVIHSILRPNYGMAIKLDLQGRIVDSLQDTNGSVVRDVAQITEHEGMLYVGNYDSGYLGRLKVT